MTHQVNLVLTLFEDNHSIFISASQCEPVSDPAPCPAVCFKKVCLGPFDFLAVSRQGDFSFANHFVVRA